jgi:hypothetical protein
MAETASRGCGISYYQCHNSRGAAAIKRDHFRADSLDCSIHKLFVILNRGAPKTKQLFLRQRSGS